MILVMRNTTTRKNAVYVIQATGFTGPDGDEFWVTGHWGRYDLFEMYDGTEALQKQEKYHGKSRVAMQDTVRKLVTQKFTRGYRLIEERSTIPEWCICLYGQRWQEWNKSAPRFQVQPKF